MSDESFRNIFLLAETWKTITTYLPRLFSMTLVTESECLAGFFFFFSSRLKEHHSSIITEENLRQKSYWKIAQTQFAVCQWNPPMLTRSAITNSVKFLQLYEIESLESEAGLRFQWRLHVQNQTKEKCQKNGRIEPDMQCVWKATCKTPKTLCREPAI